MLTNFRKSIARLIAPEYVQEVNDLSARVDSIEQKVQQRIAKVLLDLDPFDLILSKYHGVFGKDYEHPEDPLDARSQLMMKMWGYQQRDDPSFKYITEWIMNTQGNNTVRKAKNDSEWFFGRASIANILLFVKEVGRLASLYEEELENKKPKDFNSETVVEL